MPVKSVGLLSGFNTQPPEGGCAINIYFRVQSRRFNTQPPEGGCMMLTLIFGVCPLVSTHSRPKAAAVDGVGKFARCFGFNTQPPEGGCMPAPASMFLHAWFQHTAARRRLQARLMPAATHSPFQHTAARRRLLPI